MTTLTAALRIVALLLIGLLFWMVVGLLVFVAVTEACEAYPVTEHSPTGVAGCEVYGPGTASMWGGPGVARNDCVYPWTECQPIAITALDTGLTIVVTPSMYGDLYLGDDDPSNDRIVDLDPTSVAALGLDPAAGLWNVRVELVPIREAIGLPNTAMEVLND